MTGLCGGDAGDMTEAFLEGMIEGAAMGMLFCAAAAVLATSMLTVMMAHTTASSVVSIVLAIYSVSEGDYLNALVYGAVAVAGIIGVCRWYKVTYQVDYVGEKGIARFAGGSGNNSVDGIVDIMKTGNKTTDGRNIITQLDDNTNVIFRMDVGEHAHSMERYGYSNSVNHVNIEIQVKSSSGKYKPKWNFHMILDDLGEVIDSFATGIWTRQ